MRRILASQKTFTNHLADEEALASRVRHEDDEDEAAEANADAEGPEEDGMDLDVGADVNVDEEEPEPELELDVDGGAPLGYVRTAARPSKRPQRRFCEMCGYWGTYRCSNCAARYCGLQCRETHMQLRCNRFYG